MPEPVTNTPSPEEVAKAQEWLRDCPGDWAIGELADVYAQPVAELLASYAAEQGRRYEITETLTKAEFDKRFVVVHQCPAGDADCRCAEVQHQFSDKQTLDYYEESERLRKELQAAESRLTSLREGLRRAASRLMHDSLYLDRRFECVPNCPKCEAESLLAEKK